MTDCIAMSDYFQAGILAFIQGATEYLPISSSSHLIVVPVLFGWDDQGLPFDIAVHVGTLIASVWYFRADISNIFIDWVRSIVGFGSSDRSRLGWLIILASVPVAISGAMFHTVVENQLRSPAAIAFFTILFALALWLSDRYRRGERRIEHLDWKSAVLIGLGQAAAIVPGVSRSGIAMTVGLALGLSRGAAARFAFLLAIPVIAMAGVWQTSQLLASPAHTHWLIFGFAVFVSAVVAYLCIHYFLKFIERIGMLPFVVYRIVLGIALLVLFW